MASPGVSIVMATYARTALLRESLYSALHQQYDGPIEIVVLNACALQTLSCTEPVRIINAPEMADSPLGAVRDRVIRAASYPLTCLWDDDDIYLSDHIASLVAKLRDGEPAARLTTMATFDGVTFKSRSASTNACHTTMFRSSAYGTWPAAYDTNVDSGQDAEFWMRVHRSGWFVGRHHHEKDGHITAIIRTDAQRVRASQAEIGNLTPQQIRELWKARVINGEEPAGNVVITPAWSRNWQFDIDQIQKVSRD